jgi:predicted house-cleaning NTP pyrophosphatase (Maf/HAM1 superfamily)
MKKVSLTAIREFLDKSGFEEEYPEIMAELDAELNKGAEEKAARAAAYEEIHSLIVDNLSDTPITCADLFAEIEAEVTDKGMTRHNVQYALNNLWQDEIKKIPGKPNTYKRR